MLARRRWCIKYSVLPWCQDDILRLPFDFSRPSLAAHIACSLIFAANIQCGMEPLRAILTTRWK